MIRRIAKEFAKLDGYDVMLRSTGAKKQRDLLAEAKNWHAPVRTYTRNDEWQVLIETSKGAITKKATVRPEYMASINLYDVKGKLIEGLLTPDCIEARGWNLSAGQYKPFIFEAVKSEKSVAEMIEEIRNREQEMLEGLDKILAMVEGRT